MYYLMHTKAFWIMCRLASTSRILPAKCVWVWVHVCVYVCMCVSVHVCVLEFGVCVGVGALHNLNCNKSSIRLHSAHTHTHTHTHTHPHTHTSTQTWPTSWLSSSSACSYLPFSASPSSETVVHATLDHWEQVMYLTVLQML